MSQGAAPPTTTVTPVRWSHRALAVLSGLLYALGHPFVWPGHEEGVHAALTRPAHLLAWFCVVPLFWLVRGMTPWRAYLFSTWAFVPGVFVMLYWLVVAMHVFGHIPLLASLLLLLLLSFVGWNFMATAVLASRFMETRWKWPAAVAVPVSWTGMELCRAHVYFGGFPWGNLGQSQWNNTLVLQFTALASIYGLVFVVALVNTALFEVVRWRAGERARPDRVLMATGALLALVVAWGLFEMNRVEVAMAVAPRVKVGMLQGNVEQGIKNEEAQHSYEIMAKYRALQAEALEKGAELVVWPEGAMPGHVDRDIRSLEGRNFPPLGNAVAVVGIGIYWRDPPTLTGPECKVPKPPRECRGIPWLHNSAVALDPHQRVLGRFDKTHLVPFGEYVPWPLSSVARAIVPGIASYVPGERLEPVELPLPDRPRVGTLICYEGIFPRYARVFSARGANLLLNVTNDAWYGISSAAPQHMAFYATRAAENARAMARVANTGLTGGVDPLGRLMETAPVYVDAAVVQDLPIMDIGTPYQVIGDVFGYACAVPFVGALLLAIRQAWDGRRKKRAPVTANA